MSMSLLSRSVFLNLAVQRLRLMLDSDFVKITFRLAFLFSFSLTILRFNPTDLNTFKYIFI